MVGVEGEHSKPLVPAEKGRGSEFILIMCLQGDETHTEYNKL